MDYLIPQLAKIYQWLTGLTQSYAMSGVPAPLLPSLALLILSFPVCLLFRRKELRLIKLHYFPKSGIFGYLFAFLGFAWILVSAFSFKKQGRSDLEIVQLYIERGLLGEKSGFKEFLEKPVVCFDNVMSLTPKFDALTLYLENLSRIRKNDDAATACSIRIENGYLAQLSLVSGLLSRFGQNWSRIIEPYERIVIEKTDRLKGKFQNSDYKKILGEKQLFMLNCWLLWGPSIRFGGCSGWKGGSPLLQYGYGDENNSILVSMGDEYKTREFLTKNFKDNRATAIPAVLEGRICTEKSMATSKSLVKCQSDILDKDKVNTMIMKANSCMISPSPSGYYSAYLWIVFVICGKDGEPLFTGEEKWRGIYTFFEHGNVADRNIEHELKNHLAHKTVASLIKSLAQSKEGEIYFQYASAIDDAGCCEGTSCGRKSDSFGTQYFFNSEPKEETHSIIGLIKDIISSAKTASPGNTLYDMIITGTMPSEKDGDHYRSCDLPKIINDYIVHLEENAKEPVAA